MYGKILSSQWSHIIDDERMFTVGTIQVPSSQNVWTSVLKESLRSSFNLQAPSNYRLLWKRWWCPFRATKKTNQRGQGQVSVYITLNGVELSYTLHQYAPWHLFGGCGLIRPGSPGLWEHRLLINLMRESREFKSDRLRAAFVCYACCSHWKIQLSGTQIVWPASARVKTCASQ